MPGILPMKVIKVGTSAQARIAQACDRCRSKKIRCDGLRPTCSQCSNVGFECKTSDKLSRRAFPRGYTESLEERVRSLESEVREFKDLLDEKEEKIEILSKLNSYSPRRRSSEKVQKADKASVFRPPDASYVQSSDEDLLYMGNSSSRALIIAMSRRLQDVGKPSFNLDALRESLPEVTPLEAVDAGFWTPPSRIHSDQMVNIFFQEWAPLFPIVHRPTFLALYNRYVNDFTSVCDMESLALLNLVFGIAALSHDTHTNHAESCERQWTTAVAHFKDASLSTLQCLVLAQIYYIQKGDMQKLLHHKGAAIAVSQQLGLHISQKQLPVNVLCGEMRKRVFWTLYVVDCFSAALLGLPKMLREDNIDCEYPVDSDDEYINEKGFQPSLPGEYTKISCALALFRGCRILGKVLEQSYAAISQDCSLQTIAEHDSQLEEWLAQLPSHLKLEFVQDKPSTNTISSRSPLVSLTFYFTRALIHRPAVCANIGDRASASMDHFAVANTRIIQIIQLLDERRLSFSHCLNKNDLLLCAGTGVMFQNLSLPDDSKLSKHNQRLVLSAVKMLEARQAQGACEFRQLASTMFTDGTKKGQHSQLAALAERYTMAGPKPRHRHSESTRKAGERVLRALAPQPCTQSPTETKKQKRNSAPADCNLDFFRFPGDESDVRKPSMDDSKVWETLLYTLEGPALIDCSSKSVYDWPSMDGLLTSDMHESLQADVSWSPNDWYVAGDSQAGPAQSETSLSDGSMSSEDYSIDCLPELKTEV